jgi:hypothetical protein
MPLSVNSVSFWKGFRIGSPQLTQRLNNCLSEIKCRSDVKHFLRQVEERFFHRTAPCEGFLARKVQTEKGLPAMAAGSPFAIVATG